MFFKIVPWLLVLSISLAYALPAAQNNEEDDPNHVHDDNCTHPIKEAFNKMKTTVSNAYQKTKQTIGNAFNNLKNSFKKPEAEKKPDSPQGTESTDLAGGVNSGSGNVSPGRNGGSSFGGNDNTGGASNGDSPDVFNTNNGSSDDINGSNSGTSNVGANAGGQQNPLSESEVEQLIDVRFRNKPKKN